MRPSPTAAALAALLAFAVPPAHAAATDAIDIPHVRYVLPNGLTLVVSEDHKAPVVALSVWYHVGSADEPAGSSSSKRSAARIIVSVVHELTPSMIAWSDPDSISRASRPSVWRREGLFFAPGLPGPLLDAGRFGDALVAVALLQVAALTTAWRVGSGARAGLARARDTTFRPA